MNQENLLLNDAPVKKTRKPRVKKDPNAPRKLSAMQQFVIKHVSGMSGCRDAGAWKQQAKLFTQLSQIYGKEFMLWIAPPEGYQITSLVQYRTAFGKNYLSDQLVEYAKFKGVAQEKKEEIVLSEAKIGEDNTAVTSQVRAPRTLRDFLNYGKETRTNSTSQPA